MASAGFSHIFRAMRQRNFAIDAWGNALNHVGTWMQRITAGWFAWELTHSATWLGLIGLADMAGFPWTIIGCGFLCLMLWLWSVRRARTMAKTMEI